LKLFAHPAVRPGHVVVMEDRKIVAEGPLSALIQEGPQADDTMMFVNPVDAEEAKARFFEPQRRLN
jgi:hypothetical protein